MKISCVFPLLIVTIAAVSGCHLSTDCRKKRSLDSEHQHTNRRGCVASRLRLKIPSKSSVVGIFHRYNLIDEKINSELADCFIAQEKTNKPALIKGAPVKTRSLIHYYFVSTYLKNSKECMGHPDKCVKLKKCLAEMLRRDIWQTGKV